MDMQQEQQNVYSICLEIYEWMLTQPISTSVAFVKKCVVNIMYHDLSKWMYIDPTLYLTKYKDDTMVYSIRTLDHVFVQWLMYAGNFHNNLFSWISCKLHFTLKFSSFFVLLDGNHRIQQLK